MLFTSYEFLAFALALLVLYYLIPKRYQWPLLLLASYTFYFIAGSDYVIYILTTTVTVYLAARMVERKNEEQSAYLKSHKAELSREEKKAWKAACGKVKKRWVAAGLLLNLAILAVLKYTNFFLSNVNGILKLAGQANQFSPVDLVLPMGISFYTFQAIGYLLDVYRENIPAEKNIFRFALFVSFFPLLIQGPISRYGDLSESLYQPHSFDSTRLCRGLQRMLWGYFKKMVIADRILTGVSTLIAEPDIYRGAYTLVIMLFYTLELYADFTGGIDITIGISEALGVTVQENFCRPFFSKSLKEYWRRWHISMGTWFREYVFYPVSVCEPMKNFSRFSRAHFGERVGRRLPVYLASFIVWFATGIWHGASWNFIVWGLANWLILMVSEELEPLYEKFHASVRWGDSRMYQLFCVLRTFMLLCVLKLFDCYESIATIFSMFGSLFRAGNWNILWDGSLLGIGLSMVDYGILAAGTVVMIGVSLVQRGGSVRSKVAEQAYPVRACIWFGLFLAVLLMGAYGIGYDASQFIYNRF